MFLRIISQFDVMVSCKYYIHTYMLVSKCWMSGGVVTVYSAVECIAMFVRDGTSTLVDKLSRVDISSKSSVLLVAC